MKFRRQFKKVKSKLLHSKISHSQDCAKSSSSSNLRALLLLPIDQPSLSFGRLQYCFFPLFTFEKFENGAHLSEPATGFLHSNECIS